jgi:hypothetical protein
MTSMASGARPGLSRIRSICLSLPEATERPSHGTPTFFVQGKKAFVYAWMEGHHDNGFPHLWCAAAPGVAEMMIRGDSKVFFRPPYVGHRGWIGVRLDAGASAAEIEDRCEDAYRFIAPSRMVALLGHG